MSIRTYLRWYDLWVGLYVDRPNRVWYVCLLPMWVIEIAWGQRDYFLAKRQSFGDYYRDHAGHPALRGKPRQWRRAMVLEWYRADKHREAS